MTPSLKHLVALLGLALLAPLALAQTQGVTKDEIVVGTIQDLSGPIAGFGKQVRYGMQLRVDEINEQGGVHGRKIRLVVEDSAYDPKKAVLAGQKLVNQDKIFILAGNLGTAPNMSTMPVLFEKNIVNFLPVTGAKEMVEPLSKLKFGLLNSYTDQMLRGVPKMVKDKGVKHVCAIYQDDDFGIEVVKGVETALKGLNMELAERASYKRGATDFSSQVAKVKSANCDMVVLGTVIRETVGVMAEARKTGFNPVFFGSLAVYTDLVHKLGGKNVEGLYATMSVQNPYLDEASQPIRFWANKYKTKFNEDPTVFSVYGYNAIDAFIRAAQKAGPNLSTDSFIKAMDTMVIPPDIFGSAEFKYGPQKRLGNNSARLSQLQDGRWKVVSDYLSGP